MMEGPGPGVFAGIFGGTVGSGTFSSGIVIGTSRIPAPSDSWELCALGNQLSNFKKKNKNCLEHLWTLNQLKQP